MRPLRVCDLLIFTPRNHSVVSCPVHLVVHVSAGHVRQLGTREFLWKRTCFVCLVFVSSVLTRSRCLKSGEPVDLGLIVRAAVNWRNYWCRHAQDRPLDEKEPQILYIVAAFRGCSCRTIVQSKMFGCLNPRPGHFRGLGLPGPRGGTLQEKSNRSTGSCSASLETPSGF